MNASDDFQLEQQRTLFLLLFFYLFSNTLNWNGEKNEDDEKEEEEGEDNNDENDNWKEFIFECTLKWQPCWQIYEYSCVRTSESE